MNCEQQCCMKSHLPQASSASKVTNFVAYSLMISMTFLEKSRKRKFKFIYCASTVNISFPQSIFVCHCLYSHQFHVLSFVPFSQNNIYLLLSVELDTA
jgi:hypothetical protein